MAEGMRPVVRDTALHLLLLDGSEWTYEQIDKFPAWWIVLTN
jgi:hypothetical protein